MEAVLKLKDDVDNMYKLIEEHFGPAAFADPLVRPQWIGVVISIISAAADAIAANNTAHWQDGVSAKLDTIIWNEMQILSDLKQLRVDIQAMFVANDLNNLILKMGAMQKMLGTALVSGTNFDNVSGDQIDKIHRIADDTEGAAYELMEMGLGGYQFVGVGFTILAVVYRILKYNHRSFYKLCDDFTTYFTSTINKSISGSFTERLAFAQFVLSKYPPFIDHFEATCGGENGGRVTDPTPSGGTTYPMSAVLVGWYSGDRNSKYSCYAFDGWGFIGNDDKSLFPRFNKDKPTDAWEPIDPREVNARQRVYDILGATSDIASDWRWSTANISEIESACNEIPQMIQKIHELKNHYPRF
jgi:hypothetical protein